MKTYTVKELYKILGRALKKLPFMITYHGKPIAIVIDPSETSPLVSRLSNKKVKTDFKWEWDNYVSKK